MYPLLSLTLQLHSCDLSGHAKAHRPGPRISRAQITGELINAGLIAGIAAFPDTCRKLQLPQKSPRLPLADDFIF
jgi:hypothetical protein